MPLQSYSETTGLYTKKSTRKLGGGNCKLLQKACWQHEMGSIQSKQERKRKGLHRGKVTDEIQSMDRRETSSDVSNIEA